jgi:methylated-DNA-protein-cysteine methyltransferase-like protein
MDDDDRAVSAGFHDRVAAVVRRIPHGRVVTYGDVAAVLGSVRVARHVGWALAAMDRPGVPWHRVINAQGRISARGELGRVEEQHARLVSEGVVFDAAGRVDLRRWRHRFEADADEPDEP